MNPRRPLSLGICLAAGLFYWVNTQWLRPEIGGCLGWFLTCYANDLFAGLAVIAWADFLLGLGHLPSIRSWKQTVPLLLLCGVVWEVLAPLWKPGAVFDPWDFLAYQIGGGLWLLLSHRFPFQQ